MRAAERLGRHGHRDATMLLLAYRHGLRVSELCSLRWEQVDLGLGLLHVRWLKNGVPSTHPLHGPETETLRRLQVDPQTTGYVFTSERHGRMTDSTVRKLVARAGKVAGLGFPVHPHMLRHAAGYKLVNDGHPPFRILVIRQLCHLHAHGAANSVRRGSDAAAFS